MRCDVFIYLADEKGTTLPMEFGAALQTKHFTSRPIIYVVGKFNDKSPWFFHKYVKRRDTIDDVLKDFTERKEWTDKFIEEHLKKLR